VANRNSTSLGGACGKMLATPAGGALSAASFRKSKFLLRSKDAPELEEELAMSAVTVAAAQ
jgi:hypothetical protein